MSYLFIKLFASPWWSILHRTPQKQWQRKSPGLLSCAECKWPGLLAQRLAGLGASEWLVWGPRVGGPWLSQPRREGVQNCCAAGGGRAAVVELGRRIDNGGSGQSGEVIPSGLSGQLSLWNNGPHSVGVGLPIKPSISLNVVSWF